jgi:4-oxalocrotonate tautomerase
LGSKPDVVRGTMKTDYEQICAAAGAYFSAIHKGDVDMLSSLFLPEAHLYASQDGRLQVMPISEYLDLVAGRPSPRSRGHPCSGDVVSIDIAGPASAVVKVSVAVPPKAFIDLLSFVRVEDHWRIISKVYYATVS